MYITYYGLRYEIIVYLKEIKLLYRVPKAGNYWFPTYHYHYIKKLDTEQSIYDSCFLYNLASLSIVSLQMDNILFLARSQFPIKEEQGIREARLMLKDQKYLSVKRPIKFNEDIIQMTTKRILTFKQECQITAIAIVKEARDIMISIKRIVRTSLILNKQYCNGLNQSYQLLG